MNNHEVGGANEEGLHHSLVAVRASPDMPAPVKAHNVGIVFMPHSSAAWERLASLAEAIGRLGHQVTALLAPVAWAQDAGVEFCSGRGLRCVSIPPAPMPLTAIPQMARSYELWLWLREHAKEFSLLIFPDEDGIGYYSILAGYEGLAFEGTQMVCLVQGPTLYRKMQSRRLPDSPAHLAMDFMERQSVALASAILCDDEDVLAWMKAEGWPPASAVLRREEVGALLEPGRGSQASSAPPSAGTDEFPLVTVCITHFNRPELLRQSLHSIEEQDYPNYTVIVVDDGSRTPEALALLDELDRTLPAQGWRLLRQENRYLGAARNTAARHATGKYILFVDDDNYPRREMVSTLVAVAERTGADILTACMDCFQGDQPPSATSPILNRYVPLGSAAAVGLFWNCFGDSNCLIRRDKLLAVGGYTEDYGTTYEDWELYAKAAMLGWKHLTVPEGLYWYRETPGSLMKTTSRYSNILRAIRPYLAAAPDYLKPVILLAHGMSQRKTPTQQEYDRLAADKRRFEESYNHIMRKPVVRAYQFVKSLLRGGRGREDSTRPKA